MSDTSNHADRAALMAYVQSIPRCQINSLMNAAVKGMKRYYADPKNLEHFEEMQKKNSQMRGATKQNENRQEFTGNGD